MITVSPEVAVALVTKDPPALPADGDATAVMVFVLVPAADAGPAAAKFNPTTRSAAVAAEAMNGVVRDLVNQRRVWTFEVSRIVLPVF